MIEYTIISRALLDILRSDLQNRPHAIDKLREKLSPVRDMVVLCRSQPALSLYDRYLGLFRDLCGPLGDDLEVSSADRERIAIGWPVEGAGVVARLRAMRDGMTPGQSQAFAIFVSRCSDLLGNSLLADLGVSGPAPIEDELRRDSSRPELWVAAARAHALAGNIARARQLVVRACASRFAERREATEMLESWIADLYRPAY